MNPVDVHLHEEAAKKLPTTRLIIGDSALTEGSGGTFEQVNPSTGLVQATIPLAGAEEVDLAVRTARRAYETTWGSMAVSDRRRLLSRFAHLVDDHMDEFGQFAALENGTPISVWRTGCVDSVSQWMHYYAGWADKLDGIVTMGRANTEHHEYSLPEPYGVIGHIITWNGPLSSLAMKVPASLAAGNTVVIKPSEFTPFTAVRFAELALEAGIPPGVVNVLPGTQEAGEALVLHPDVPKLSFTGGVTTALKIAANAATMLKPLVLELGGKSANLFFADGDIAAVAAFCGVMPMFFSGQGCALPTRLLVEADAYDQVVDLVSATLSSMVVGDPFDPSTAMGPVISAAAAERIVGQVSRAVNGNAGRLAVGGGRLDLPGFFVEPTLLTEVDNASEIAQNEVFGPVLCMSAFSDEDEAVRLANATRYGLAAWVQTRDTGRANRLIHSLEAGTVYVNPGPGPLSSPHTPFGGIGFSGMGREGGRAGIEEFLRYKGVGVSRF